MAEANARFLNLQTCVYRVGDLAEAKAWYTEVLGAPPYFDEPFYVGFSVSGYELGLMPGGDASADASPNMYCYFGVTDAKAEYGRLLELGGSELEAPHDVGEGIVVAAVRDPFGNPFGVIENPHFTK